MKDYIAVIVLKAECPDDATELIHDYLGTETEVRVLDVMKDSRLRVCPECGGQIEISGGNINHVSRVFVVLRCECCGTCYLKSRGD